MAETYRERAERGAALLDRLMPRWYQHIDKEKLDLSSCYDCVCGQLAAKSGARMLRKSRSQGNRTWHETLRWIVRRLGGSPDDYFHEQHEHGFLADTEYGYRVLDKEWRRIIEERLEEEANAA